MIDPLISKRQQLLLATQLCRMVLKVRFVFLFRIDSCRRYFTNALLHPSLPQDALLPHLLPCARLSSPFGVELAEQGNHMQATVVRSCVATMGRTGGADGKHRSHGSGIESIPLQSPGALLLTISFAVLTRYAGQ